MASWILIYSFLVPNNTHFNQPVIMGHFATKAQCETTLAHIDQTYKQANITGSGHCWGEQK